MYISFGRRLGSLWGFRIGAGVRMRGTTGAFLWFLFAMAQLFWYVLLGTCCMMYGLSYLLFYLPIRGIVRACKNHQSAPNE